MLISPALIKEVQSNLADLNLYEGKLDGIAGKLTEAAVIKWQYLHGHKPTGLITEVVRRNTKVLQLHIRQIDAPPNKKPKYPHDDTKSLTAFYGQPGDESQHTFIDLPYKMKLAWEPTTLVSRIRIHQKCAEDFLGFFHSIFEFYSPQQIKDHGLDMFGGSFNNRAIRGGTRASTHAYACAIDLNPAENQLSWSKNRALFGATRFQPLMEMGRKNNLVNLGDAKGFDYMHWQAAWVS